MKIFKQIDKTRGLDPDEIKSGENVMKNCLAVKPQEKVLVVTDSKKITEAQLFFESAKNFSQNVQMIVFNTMTQNAQEPPKKVVAKMLESDVLFLVTSFSLSHTQARKKATQKGARIASLPGITIDIIKRTLSLDYSQMSKLTQSFSKKISGANQVEITSDLGTNLKLNLGNRQALSDTGIITQPGDFSNLPAGEAFVAPLEEKTQGVAVFDGAIAGVDLDKPVKAFIKNGKAVKFEGGSAAKKIKAQINQAGSKARLVAELGIGTNPKCKLSPNMLEAEKAYGTVHLAFGNNATFGGKNQVAFHSDCLITSPTLKLDGKIVLQKGEFI